MGNLALEQGKSVEDIVTDGPGLVFVVFPHALSKMPLPQLWSVVFFGMLILLGIDSQVKLILSFTTNKRQVIVYLNGDFFYSTMQSFKEIKILRSN